MMDDDEEKQVDDLTNHIIAWIESQEKISYHVGMAGIAKASMLISYWTKTTPEEFSQGCKNLARFYKTWSHEQENSIGKD